MKCSFWALDLFLCHYCICGCILFHCFIICSCYVSLVVLYYFAIQGHDVLLDTGANTLGSPPSYLVHGLLDYWHVGVPVQGHDVPLHLCKHPWKSTSMSVGDGLRDYGLYYAVHYCCCCCVRCRFDAAMIRSYIIMSPFL